MLKRRNLTFKRPGSGLEPFRLGEVLGRRLVRDVAADAPLTPADLEAAVPQGAVP